MLEGLEEHDGVNEDAQALIGVFGFSSWYDLEFEDIIVAEDQEVVTPGTEIPMRPYGLDFNTDSLRDLHYFYFEINTHNQFNKFRNKKQFSFWQRFFSSFF
jgi:hypothetical protein